MVLSLAVGGSVNLLWFRNHTFELDAPSHAVEQLTGQLKACLSLIDQGERPTSPASSARGRAG